MTNIPSLAKYLLGLLFIVCFIIFLRYPYLANSSIFLSSDEAPHAWLIKSLMDGAPLFYYFSDKNYHGITIGLAAIPFFWVLGVNALAYKLPAIMFHSFYVLTAYFIAKRIDKEIGLLVAFLLLMAPPYIVEITTQNWPHHIIALLGNIMFLIFMKLKLHEQKNNKGLIFLLFLIAGFSIYTYTYSILFIFTVFALLTLTNESWQEIRSGIFNFSPKTLLNSEHNRAQKTVRILDIIIFFFIVAIIFSYVFGGFGLDIAGISIFQINKLHKPVLQLIILLIARCMIYRSDLKQKLSQAKQLIKTFSPEAKSISIIALSGFVIGILPRILSIVSGQVKKGGEGFDIDFSPIKLALHFKHLFITSFPELLGLRTYIHELITNGEISTYSMIMATASVALLGLFSTAAFSFYSSNSESIKNIFKINTLNYKPELILSIFFITVCGANIISQTGPLYPRYIYPLQMVLIIWVALYLKNIKNKSPAAFFLALTIWSGFYITTNYENFSNASFVKNFEVIKKKEPLDDVIKFFRSENISVVYGDFLFIYKANFLSDNSPFFIEYLTKPKYFSSDYFREKVKQSKKQPNFAIITHMKEDKNIYLDYLNNNKIDFRSTSFNKYIIYSNFKGPSQKINALRTLMDEYYNY